MAKVSVYNMEGKTVGDIELSDDIFAVAVNEHLMHLSVVAHMAAKRQGTQKARTRSEVRGGGRKPWRQKGTGHARQGSIRAPQWTGGGVVFAPVPREYTKKLNKKERRLALKSAFSSKVSAQKLIVMDELKLDSIKTKDFAKVMSNLGVDKALVVLGSNDTTVAMSARNIPFVKTAVAERDYATLNVYDILKYNTLILTKEAVANIEEVYR